MHAERIVVFAKAPVPGQVKTRLIPRLGAAGAARLHEALLRDVLRTSLARAGSDTVLFHHPEDAGASLEHLGVALRPQRGGDLGERMRNAFAEQSAAGVERVVVVGSDSPDLPPDRLDQAFDALRRSPLVIGPAVDGGYYLIGARGVPEAALAGIPWGTDAVLAATLARLREARLGAMLLDAWYDVDRPEDLKFLKAHIDFLLETSGEDRCPATRCLLDALGPGS